MVYVDDISTVGDADDIRKGIRNCAEMERKKKFIYGMEKTRYMVIKTGKGKEIDEEVGRGKVQKIINNLTTDQKNNRVDTTQ